MCKFWKLGVFLKILWKLSKLSKLIYYQSYTRIIYAYSQFQNRQGNSEMVKVLKKVSKSKKLRVEKKVSFSKKKGAIEKKREKFFLKNNENVLFENFS